MKILAQNKKAFHDYEILDKVEAGIVLTGDEVKAARQSQVNLKGSFAQPKGGELFIINAHISPYSHSFEKTDEKATRSRKLLLHKKEINKLVGNISKKGITLVPLKMYLNKKGIIKIELGICKHKKAHKRKEELKERDIKRETQRELRGKK